MSDSLKTEMLTFVMIKSFTNVLETVYFDIVRSVQEPCFSLFQYMYQTGAPGWSHSWNVILVSAA